MDTSELNTPVTDIEIAELQNAEGMLPAGKCIIRRMAFELLQLRSDSKKSCSQMGGVSINLCRQWFDAVQDLNPGYLEGDDYRLAKELYESLCMRVPDSILDKIGV